MGNCCVTPSVQSDDRPEKKSGKNKPNPFAIDYGANHTHKSYVLDNPGGKRERSMGSPERTLVGEVISEMGSSLLTMITEVERKRDNVCEDGRG